MIKFLGIINTSFSTKNEDKINLSIYIFNHLFDAKKDSTKLCKKNIPYARLLPKLFFHGRLIDALKSLSDNEDLEEIYRNILSTSILVNMNIKKKCEVIASKIPFSIKCTNFVYIEDYPVITKMDNPEVIKNFITQFF